MLLLLINERIIEIKKNIPLIGIAVDKKNIPKLKKISPNPILFFIFKESIIFKIL